jgi:hypothetical protein
MGVRFQTEEYKRIVPTIYTNYLVTKIGNYERR